MNKKDFHKCLRNSVLLKFDNIEKNRKKTLKNIKLMFLSILLLAGLTYFLFLTKNLVLILLAIILAFICLGIFIFIPIKIFLCSINYSEDLKNRILPELLQNFCNLERVNTKIALEDDLSSSGLFPRYTIFQFDDKFQGQSNGVSFEILEAESPTREIIIGFKSNKNFKNRTIIVSKRALFQKNSDLLLFWIPIFIFALVTIFGVGSFDIIKLLEYILFVGLYIVFFSVVYFLGTKPFNPEKLSKILLEDVEIKKKYDVYSSDEVESRYILTTTMIERLLHLKTSFKSKSLKCSFYNDKLIIVLKTNKDLFELGSLFHSVYNFKTFDSFYDEMSSVLEIIKYLKLDEKTGL